MGPSILPNRHSLLHTAVIHLNARSKSHHDRLSGQTRPPPPVRTARDPEPRQRRSIEETRRHMRRGLQRRGKSEGGGQAPGFRRRGPGT